MHIFDKFVSLTTPQFAYITILDVPGLDPRLVVWAEPTYLGGGFLVTTYGDRYYEIRIQLQTHPEAYHLLLSMIKAAAADDTYGLAEQILDLCLETIPEFAAFMDSRTFSRNSC